MKTWKRRALVVAGVAGVALASVLPGWMLDHGTNTACKEAALTEEAPTPATCERRQRLWLSLPSIAPWTRERATASLDRAARRRAEIELLRATAGRPDAALRDTAARTQIEIAEAAGDAEASTSALHDAFDAGAYGVVASQRASTDLGRASYVHRAARTMGDGEALRAATRVPAEKRGDDWMALRHQGARLCLFGHEADGAKVVERATRASGFQGPSVRVTLALCGASVPPEPYQEHLVRLAQSFRRPEEPVDWPDLMRGSFVRVAPPETRLPAVAVTIAGRRATQSEPQEAPVPLREALALVMPRFSRVVAPTVAVTPHALIVARTREPHPIPLVALETAAERAEELAKSADSPLPAPDRGVDLLSQPDAHALKNPAGVLREAAWAMWYEAAAERWWRGDLAGAKRALGRSVPMAPEGSEIFTAALALLVQEPAIALSHSQRCSRTDPVSRVIVDLQRAMALAALGQADQALTAARAADERARRSSDGALTPSDELKRRGIALAPQAWRADAAWLHAAAMVLAARSRKQAPVEDMTAPEAWSSADDANFAFHWQLARAPESDRRRLRTRAVGRSLTDVVVSHFVVYGAGAPDDAVETWLDRATAPYAAEEGRATLWARAEAARWRGDPAAARTWDERGQRLARLITDDRTAVLAKLSGL